MSNSPEDKSRFYDNPFGKLVKRNGVWIPLEEIDPASGEVRPVEWPTDERPSKS